MRFERSEKRQAQPLTPPRTLSEMHPLRREQHAEIGSLAGVLQGRYRILFNLVDFDTPKAGRAHAAV